LLLLSEIPGAFWPSLTNPKRSMPQHSARCNHLKWICMLDGDDWDIVQRHWWHWCDRWRMRLVGAKCTESARAATKDSIQNPCNYPIWIKMNVQNQACSLSQSYLLMFDRGWF
jgi:hypothetical protein